MLHSAELSNFGFESCRFVAVEISARVDYSAHGFFDIFGVGFIGMFEVEKRISFHNTCRDGVENGFIFV